MSVDIIDEKNYKEVINKVSNAANIKFIILFLDEDIDMMDNLSWIWNADFGILRNISKIYCCGKRNRDIFLKLKLDNLDDNIFLEYDYQKILKDKPKDIGIITSDWSISKLKDIINDN